MRIVGGRLKGRALLGPSSQAIRPTADRLRESLFNILAHAYGDPVPGARAVDLFAGTGALGLEALSRGARSAVFVDDRAEARALLRGNIEALGLGGHARIFRHDATKLGQAPAGEAFSLAFLDPPYGRDLAGPALQGLRVGGWLAAGALLVVEASGVAALALPEGFALAERRDFGGTQLLFLRAT